MAADKGVKKRIFQVKEHVSGQLIMYLNLKEILVSFPKEDSTGDKYVEFM